VLCPGPEDVEVPPPVEAPVVGVSAPVLLGSPPVVGESVPVLLGSPLAVDPDVSEVLIDEGGSAVQAARRKQAIALVLAAGLFGDFMTSHSDGPPDKGKQREPRRSSRLRSHLTICRPSALDAAARGARGHGAALIRA
jgi:hypothetical protein